MILVWDSETTGLKAGMQEIVQLAGILLDESKPGMPEVASWSSYMRPMRPHEADERALKTNRLTLAGLSRERHPKEVLAEFAAFAGSLGVPVPCAHNIAFDMRFLDAAEKEHGVTVPRSHASVCTMQAARKHLGSRTANHQLATLAAHYKIEFGTEGAHDAMADVRVTAEVLRRMYGEAPHVFGGAIATPLLAPAGVDHLAPRPRADDRAPLDRVVQIAGPAPQSPLEEMMAELAMAIRHAKVSRDYCEAGANYLELLTAQERYESTTQYIEALAAEAAVVSLEATIKGFLAGCAVTSTPWGDVGFRPARTLTHSAVAVRELLAPDLAKRLIEETVNKAALDAAVKSKEITPDLAAQLDARATVKTALTFVCKPAAEAVEVA